MPRPYELKRPWLAYHIAIAIAMTTHPDIELMSDKARSFCTDAFAAMDCKRSNVALRAFDDERDKGEIILHPPCGVFLYNSSILLT